MPWGDIVISVTAAIPLPATTPLGMDYNAEVATCEAAPDAVSPQVWHIDFPYAGYLSNAVSGTVTCLNLYGCTPRLVYFSCCTSCGCSDAQGFLFALQPNGSLTAALLPGLCASVLADNTTVSMVACAAGDALQRWSQLPATLQLVNAGTGACLQSQLRAQLPYAQICARVTAYNTFDGQAPVPGYCLQLRRDGSWVVLAGAASLANGTLAPGFDATQPTALELTAQGDTVSVKVAGQVLGAWPGGGAFTAGMVAIGSGVHAAIFDDFLVALPLV